jgi:DMSO/TMAO reductase YedYZ heme-binding membrane subunit
MSADPLQGADRGRRWAKGLEVSAIVVVVGYVVFLSVLLLMGGDGDATSHGGMGQGQSHGPGDPSADGDHAAGSHAPPAFTESFGFAGLVSSVAYLGLLAAWAWLRRDYSFLARHLASAAAMFLLVVLYLNAMGGFAYNGHTWNRSFANASVVLLAVTLAIGPLARLWRAARHALAWRREIGIWGTIAAVMHVGIFWQWSLDWAWRPFFYPGMHGEVAETMMGDRGSGLLPTVFNLANVVGLVALVYALVLAITSNDASQRWLKSGWSWLQNRATTMWLLVLAHAWAFAYYIEGPSSIRSGTLWVSFWMVLLLQTMAFAKHVWLRPAWVGVQAHATPPGT